MRIKAFTYSIFGAVAVMLSSCSSKDEPQPVATGTINLSFKYDNNMTGDDWFAKEISSVAVWAFDKNGKIVWSHSEKIDQSTAEDFSITANIPVGEYNFVTWCGLTSEMPMLPTLSPSSISQLNLSIPIADDECKAKLPAIFNGNARDITISEDESNDLTFNLTRVTKDLRIIIQGVGVHVNSDELDFAITNAPNTLEWDMTLKSTAKFEYLPYNVESSIDETAAPGLETPDYSIVIADFSTLCFDEDRAPTLIIKRRSDGRTILNISLVSCFLQAKPFEADSWSNQEYLDRKNDYTLAFFFDDKLLTKSSLEQ
ncbi:MAG: FimB/Mfa2 family fimbrial subunit [Bacteroidales bacterium]|nr:FimB/Mfa2 family fimbrial subunit [Bacteroidales bacterium]